MVEEWKKMEEFGGFYYDNRRECQGDDDKG